MSGASRISGLFLVVGLFAFDIAMAAYHATPPSAPAVTTAEPAPWQSAWTQRRTHAGVLYFLDNTTPRIRRYQVASASWLADVVMPGTADAFDVDGSGIYVKFGDRVERYALDGATHAVIPSVGGTWSMLEVIGNALVLGDENTLSSYNKNSGAPISSIPVYYGFAGTSTIDGEGRLFGRSIGVSPADIQMATMDPATGVLLSFSDSPYHGSYPAADLTYARDAGGFVADSSGTVYSAAALEYLGNLGGPIAGAAFLQDRFVVIRGASLSVFSNDLHELGTLTAPVGLIDIAVVDNHLYAISGSIGSLHVDAIDVSLARPRTPPPARDWNETGAHADFILGDADRLVLVSKVEHAGYRFRPQDWAFDLTTPLLLNPIYAAYSAVDDRLYASYDGGAIYAFAGQAPGTANWLAATPYTAFGLANAGEYVFAADMSGAWATHYMFSPAGTLLSNVEWNYYSRQYEWDPVARRMYFFRDDTSPNDLHFEQIALDGSIAAEGETPYHGEVQAQTPIRVAPDGARVVLGSGQVFETGGLTIIGNTGPVDEIAWLFGDLYTISSGDEPKLQRYNASYNVVSSGRVRGTPRRLLPSGSGFVYVTDIGSTTVLGRLDGFLTQADLAVDPFVPGSVFGNGSVITLQVSVGNNGTVPSHSATVNANLSGLEDASWHCVPVALVGGCDSATVSGSIADVIDLQDGGQAVYQISGRIPVSARGEVQIRIEIDPAISGTDPELRNNAQVVRIPLDRLFDDGFD